MSAVVSLTPRHLFVRLLFLLSIFLASIHGEGNAASADVYAVEVVCSEGGVALGALPLACVVACLNALEAEDVEALCQYRILHPRVAARTR